MKNNKQISFYSILKKIFDTRYSNLITYITILYRNNYKHGENIT